MIHATSLAQLAALGIRRAVLTFGIFDGLHRGHQAIVARLLELAHAEHAAPVVVTFEPHPERILCPGKAPRLVMGAAHKRHLLAQMGIAATVVMPFTPEFAQLPPERFLHDVLLASGLELRGICVGRHWRFGHRGQGHTGTLAEFGRAHGFPVCPVAETPLAGAPVSSTRLRQAIAAGDLAACRELLGRSYSLYGRVAFGKGIATSELHYPTANVASENELFPPLGIYAASAVLPSAEGSQADRLPGVLYLGQAPTYFDRPPERPFVEMHIFDFSGDIYGQTLEVELLDFIRGDRKFPSPAELARQIALDVAEARRRHAPRG